MDGSGRPKDAKKSNRPVKKTNLSAELLAKNTVLGSIAAHHKGGCEQAPQKGKFKSHLCPSKKHFSDLFRNLKMHHSLIKPWLLAEISRDCEFGGESIDDLL